MIDEGAWRVIEAIILVSPGLYAAWVSRRAKVLASENSATLAAVVHNTNGMSKKIETMARAAGVTEGQESERRIGEDKATAVAAAVTAARTDTERKP